MKECKYCRTMYADNLLVCPNCGGNKIVTAEERAEEFALKQKEKENRENAMAEPLKMRKNILIGLGTVVGLLLLIIVITSVNANKPYSNGTTKDQAAELLDTGKECFDKGEYEAAIECFAQLPIDSKEYAEAQSMMKKSKEAYKTHILKKVDDYVQNEEYEVALEMLKKTQTLLTDDAELKSVYNKIYDSYKTLIRNCAISEAENYVKSGDYENAIATINSAIQKIKQDEDLSAKLSVYEDKYVGLTVSSAKNQYVEYNANSIYNAEAIIEKALKLFPNNQNLASELKFYKEHEPIKIISMSDSEKGSSQGTFSIKGNAKDNYGNTYSDIIYVERFAFDATESNRKSADYGQWWWYCYKTIDIDYQYSKITGIFFQNEAYENASTKTKFEVSGYKNEDATYGSDENLWTGVITGSSVPVIFNIDVSGRKYISLTFKGDYTVGAKDKGYEYAYLAELYLWK